MAAPDWRESQRRLFNLVTSPQRTQRGAPGLRGLLKQGGSLRDTERIEIYRRMYWARTLDSLAEDYPGVQALLGGPGFVKAAEAYLVELGSDDFSLRGLGRRFPAFLRRHLGAVRPDVVDAARYEWAQVEAFDGGARPALAAADLAAPRLERRTLLLQPYVQLLRVRYPVGEYVASLKSDGVLRTGASQAYLESKAVKARQLPRLRPEPAFALAVHRWEGRLYFKRLAPGEYRLLAQFRRGASLNGALQACWPRDGARVPPAADELSSWFRTWTSLGWLARGTPSLNRINAKL